MREAGSLQYTDRNRILMSKLARIGGPIDNLSQTGFAKKSILIRKSKPKATNDESASTLKNILNLSDPL